MSKLLELKKKVAAISTPEAKVIFTDSRYV